MAGQQGETKDKMVESFKTIGKTLVKPRKKLGRSKCQPVTFGLPYLELHYNQKLMFYKGGDFEGKVKKLKDGLEQVLEEFYQLAGKLGKDEKGAFRVEYDDDKAGGVEVVEAVAETVTVEALAAEEGTSSFKDLIPYYCVLNSEGLHRPLLAIQLTKLKDGIAIGCAFNHAVLDGTSTGHFMRSWAQACRGARPKSPPSLDRTKSRNTRVKPDPSSPSSNGDHAQPAPPPLPTLCEKVFRFSESSIDKLKSAINASVPSNGSMPFTTFQALSAHIWRHVTKARELKPGDLTVCTVFAECWKCDDEPMPKDKPMPETNFWDLIQAIFPNTTAQQLTKSPREVGADIMQKAILKHNDKAKEFQFNDAGMNCVAIGRSLRFKVPNVDFGWGRPEGVRSWSNNRFDGMVYLYQGKSGGKSTDVEITLEAGVMEKLESDGEFLEPLVT